MQLSGTWFVLLAACMIAPPTIAGTSVMTRFVAGGVTIQAVATVEADAETLWSTLTDYNALARFVPGMTSSRVISAPGAYPLFVEQKRESSLLSLLIPDHVVLAMDEQPPGRIGFRSVTNRTVAMNGEWLISGERPLRLVYRARIMSIVPPPPLVTERYLENEVRQRINALVREAERRGLALRSGKPGGV